MYRLADNVFSCLANDRMVFLDLERNKYSCLSIRDTHTATSILAGSSSYPCGSPSNKREIVGDEANRVLRALMAAGLVIQAGLNQSDRHTHSSDIAIPKTSLDAPGAGRTALHPIRYSTAFYRSALKTSWKLRYWAMKRVVQTVAHQRRRKGMRKFKNDASIDELIAVFTSLRAYYVREYLCLFDSLCLIEFLGQFGHLPTWVFGVKTDPFAAHCWVQDGTCVLNDHIDFVRAFTPIMEA